MKLLAEEAVKNSKMISEQNVYADGLSISDTLREKADAFERHFEEYLPLARIYNEKLTDLADENQALIRQFKKGWSIDKIDANAGSDGVETFEIPRLKERFEDADDRMVVDIGLEKLKKLEEQTAGAVEQQYDGVKGMVRLIHEQIDGNVKRLAKEAIDNSKVISTQKVYANGVTISDALRKNADDFEKHFEDYLPCARIYNEKLMELADENQALMCQFKADLSISTISENSDTEADQGDEASTGPVKDDSCS
ncbi:unnamed protein product, partial [Mesorhabditis spiculigera]